MQKKLALELEKEAQRIAIAYSDPGRAHNQNRETFEVHEIIPLSEYVAASIFEKNTGKRALFVFFYTRQGGGSWRHFVPTDSHILGLQQVPQLKAEVEMYNYHMNFNDDQLQRGWSPARALLANRRVRVLLSLLGLEPATAHDHVPAAGPDWFERKGVDTNGQGSAGHGLR